MNPEPLQIKEEPQEELQRPEEANGSTLILDTVVYGSDPVCKGAVSLEQQERNSSLLQEEPEAPRIKYEQEEELLQRPEEADRSTQTLPLAVKSEDGEETKETEPVAGTSTEHTKKRAHVEHWVPRPTSGDKLLPSDCSESDITEDSDDWQETGEGQSLKSQDTQNVGGQTLSLSNKLSHGDPTSSTQTQSTTTSHAERGRLTCTVCGKVGFGKMHLLRRHMRIHTGEKPFPCTVCEQRFSQAHNLKTHMRTHTGEKPFKCPICQKGFGQSSHLNTHMRTHAEENPLTCTVCQKSLHCNSNLKKHMRTHTGERPFSCTVCGQTFVHKHNLKAHMMTHTGEKPFTCTVCQKGFSQSAGLKTHMWTHTGEKPFSCAVCKREFFHKRSLKLHMRTHAGE